MLGLRLTTDCAPRTKNGKPAHSTTDTVSTSSTQLCVAISNQPRLCPNIASTVTTAVSVHQKQRWKSSSSGFSASSNAGMTGSSDIPYVGQLPGWSWRIFGCMGQV